MCDVSYADQGLTHNVAGVGSLGNSTGICGQFSKLTGNIHPRFLSRPNNLSKAPCTPGRNPRPRPRS